MQQRKHGFPPITDSEVRLLILGSLPGDRSLKEQRYYAHPQNQFWQLLSGVVGLDLVALPYAARLEALLAAHIGLWDSVASATRPGSTDAAIRDIIQHDIAALAVSLPKLRAIAFNGGTALKHGVKQLGDTAKRYEIVALPSSSALHTIGFAAKVDRWHALSKFTH